MGVRPPPRAHLTRVRSRRVDELRALPRHAGGMAERFYRITIRGVLTERLASAFEPLSLTRADGRTVLSGFCTDAAALYGIIDRLRDLSLELLAVEASGSTRTEVGIS